MPLRVLLWLCLAGLIAGDLWAHAGASLAPGHWTMLIALGVGTLATLAYCGHLLLLRFQLSLRSLVVVFVLQAITLLCISQSLPWIAGSGEKVGAFAGNPVKMGLLAAATLAVLAQACAAVCWHVHWLPAWAWYSGKLRRPGGMLLSDEVRYPRGWLFGVYLTAPLVLWGGVQLAIYTFALPDTARRYAWLNYLILLALSVRVILGLWTWLAAFQQWRVARANKDVVAAAESRSVLFGRGLLPAALLSFYALMLTSVQVQEESSRRLLIAEQRNLEKQISQLRASPADNDENAFVEYTKIRRSIVTRSLALPVNEPWSAPDSLLWLRTNSNLMNTIATGARKLRFVVPEFGVDTRALAGEMIDSRCIDLLIARAGQKGEWQTILDALNFSTKPFVMESEAQLLVMPSRRGTSVVTAVCSLCWHQQASENILAGVQDQIRTLANRHIHAERRLMQQILLENMWEDIETKLEYTTSLKPKYVTHDEIVDRHPWSALARRNHLASFNDQYLRALHGPFSRELLEYLEIDFKDLIRKFPVSSPKRIFDFVERQCTLALADAALAVARYKLKHNRWPDSLKDCVPEFLPSLPRDPFKPDDFLRFDAFQPRVYSAGLNRQYEPEKRMTFGKEIDDLQPHLTTPECDDLVIFLTRPDFDLHSPRFASDDDYKQAQLRMYVNIQDLKRDDELIQVTALKHLELLGTKAAPAVPHLLPLLHDKKLRVRLWTAYTLGRIGPAATESVEALKGALVTDPDPDFHYFVRDALKKIQRK